MRADKNVDPAFGKRTQYLFPRAPALPAGQHVHLHTSCLRERFECGKMLARQKLGGRHQRGLRTGLDRVQHRQHGDNRFAGADIALQQPQHARVPPHIHDDFPKHVLLCLRQSEGESRARESGAFSVADESPALAHPQALADEDQRKLVGEEFVKREPRPRGRVADAASGPKRGEYLHPGRANH